MKVSYIQNPCHFPKAALNGKSMTGNYGYFLKYTAFAAFLLGLYKREKNEKKLFPKIEKALTQVITCLQQFFAWEKKNYNIYL